MWCKNVFEYIADMQQVHKNTHNLKVVSIFAVSRIWFKILPYNFHFSYSALPNKRYAWISVTPDKFSEINKRYGTNFTLISVTAYKFLKVRYNKNILLANFSVTSVTWKYVLCATDVTRFFYLLKKYFIWLLPKSLKWISVTDPNKSVTVDKFSENK